MAFALIRARNLKITDLSSTDRHNARRYDSREQFPPNINPSYTKDNDNRYWGGNTLMESWKTRAEGVTGMRSDSNIAIEYVLGINDMKAYSHKLTPEMFLNKAMRWLNVRHGAGSVIASSIHFDESNPHVHVVVVPIETKEVKWKNRRGEGVKVEKRIDTRSYTGGRLKLRKLQDDFFAFTKSFQDDLKMPIYRGKLVENQTKEYIEKTSHEIGEMRNRLQMMADGIEKMKLSLEIEEKRKKIEESNLKLKEINRDKDSRDDKWKEKGVKDNPVIFHTEQEHKKEEKKRGNKGLSM